MVFDQLLYIFYRISLSIEFFSKGTVILLKSASDRGVLRCFGVGYLRGVRFSGNFPFGLFFYFGTVPPCFGLAAGALSLGLASSEAFLEFPPGSLLEVVPDPEAVDILLKVGILMEDLIELMLKGLNFPGEVVLAMEPVFPPFEFKFEIFDLVFKFEVFFLELKVPDVRAGSELVVLGLVVAVGLVVVSDQHLLDDVVDLEVRDCH